MKKGFTLIELLVVMVVIGILVAVALPKYKTAMERGRGLEGMANAAAVSDALNAYYIRNYNSYGTDVNNLKQYANKVNQETTNKFFSHPSDWISLSSGTATVKMTRNLSSKSYTIVFVNTGGETTARYCTGYQRYCNALGAVNSYSSGWSF